MKQFQISLFQCVTDNKAQVVTRTWQQLCEKFSKPQVRFEKDGLLFAPCVFEPPLRRKENVKELSMLVFDCDHFADFDKLVESLRKLQCAFTVYSTHSHLRKTNKNPDAEQRFRAVIPLAENISANDFLKLWKAVSMFFNLPIDESAKDVSRIYYTPAIASADAPYQYHIEQSEIFFQWREWLTQHSDQIPKIESECEKVVSAGEVSDRMVFFYHEDRHAEFCRRVELQAIRNERGVYEMRCPVHSGESRTSLIYFPDVQKASCLRKPTPCDYFSLLRAFNLSDGKLPSRKQATANHSQTENNIPFPELSSKALYGLAGDVVRTIEPHTESDNAALLIQFLVAFGNAIGRTAFCRVEATRHYMNLFTVIVGESSKSRKGTSWQHIKNLFERCSDDWSVKCLKSGLSTGEGLISAVRDASYKTEPIKEKGRVVGYQDVMVDGGESEKRALIIASEFALVLRVLCREGNTLSAVIRDAWDTGRLQSMPKNNPIKATDAHISIISNVTAIELRRNLSETEAANGFANRFLWVSARRSKLLPDGGNLTDAEINPLVMRLQAAIEFAANDFELKRDDEAAALWRKGYAKLSESYEGLFGSVTSRAEAQVIRLSCVYALLDSSKVVRREHLEAALALWQYCEDSARYIFGNATGDKVADALLTALREAGEHGLTKTQIRDVLGRNVNAFRIKDALSILEKSQLIHSIKEPSDDPNAKRPVERFFISTLNDINDFNQDSDERTRNNAVKIVNVVKDSEKILSDERIVEGVI